MSGFGNGGIYIGEDSDASANIIIDNISAFYNKDILLVNNRIRNMVNGIVVSEERTGFFSDNMTSGATAAYDIVSGVVNAGNNW